MFLRHFKVSNYKTFESSGPIIFAPGINIIVGKNNSGKSSLLEAMSLRPEKTPHIRYKQNNWLAASQDEKTSNITVTFCLSGKETLDIIFDRITEERFSKIKLSSETARIASAIDIPIYRSKPVALVKHLLQEVSCIGSAF